MGEGVFRKAHPHCGLKAEWPRPGLRTEKGGVCGGGKGQGCSGDSGLLSPTLGGIIYPQTAQL